MSNILSIDAKPQSVKKFYFLDYFYVLLKSVQTHSTEERVFEQFLTLKQTYHLGLSKYRRMTADEQISPARLGKYRYTFQQVVTETVEYNLIKVSNTDFSLTSLGEQALEKYETKSPLVFNQFLFQLMEDKYQAFHYLLGLCYEANPNPEKSGLLIFPIYSAYRLGIERGAIKTSGDLGGYLNQLKTQLEKDIHKHLGKTISLDNKNRELVYRLIKAELLPENRSDLFDSKKYNVILKRVRDFWLRYFLSDLYNYRFSLSSFDIWAYRAKQIGILHITEFYPDPNFNGRIVYPLAVLKKATSSRHFHEIYSYSSELKLYQHLLSWEDEDDRQEFVQSLHHAYLDARQSARTYFVNLANIRERVCYNLRIPEHLFDEFLSYAYHDNKLTIRISLEVDRLPEETSAMYLRRAPVMVDGKYRNIIAIDLV